MSVDFIFSIAILIMSVVIHEVSHGYVADSLGDPTARYAGRLTLNPLKHLDPVGSVIVPVVTYLFGGFIFGWARPVPYNPYNLKNQKRDPGIVAVAGPLSNILVAVVFGLTIRFASLLSIPEAFIQVASLIVFINLLLAFFNLIPIPPLDGSKVLFMLLPIRWYKVQPILEQYGMILLIFFILFLFQYILPVIFYAFRFITGQGVVF
ncbi:MAG: site-2 protease family protein [Candidatus Niyogibacteria bacterium CG10_big_fil_rev_8_21_14_0_10_42_19]|uniref:Site-2 protease family protein n=1 Tax=Candidatus Niyogibacteria bacterium CG10_big_fil_rev_8_21_14_0_10_42_19 TaxID=1974725 RepID=A0A2H0TGH8_9BACT|nr:MAG: site-2 protease family protein [Candidatus Niyogibacteria bacterium CG10_big_fil_rev_8_21_14_0_10_42_19]